MKLHVPKFDEKMEYEYEITPVGGIGRSRQMRWYNAKQVEEWIDILRKTMEENDEPIRSKEG